MPEGPSITILKESILHFEGKKLLKATGNSRIDFSRFENEQLLAIKSWGKQLILCFKKFNIRIHLLMFGSYSLDEQTKPDRSLRLSLSFSNGTVYFYTCAVTVLQAQLDDLYDWKADVMSELWNPARARKKLKALPGLEVCDALLDQQIFSGVGNIIKTEVLYRIRLHPETLIGDLPPRKLGELIKEARNYSFDFYAWKKVFVLRKHWLAYTKKTCKRCDLPFLKKYCGHTKRRTFFCTNCQILYPLQNVKSSKENPSP